MFFSRTLLGTSSSVTTFRKSPDRHGLLARPGVRKSGTSSRLNTL